MTWTFKVEEYTDDSGTAWLLKIHDSQCNGTNKQDQRCGSYIALGNNRFCYHHRGDPPHDSMVERPASVPVTPRAKSQRLPSAPTTSDPIIHSQEASQDLATAVAMGVQGEISIQRPSPTPFTGPPASEPPRSYFSSAYSTPPPSEVRTRVYPPNQLSNSPTSATNFQANGPGQARPSLDLTNTSASEDRTHVISSGAFVQDPASAYPTPPTETGRSPSRAGCRISTHQDSPTPAPRSGRRQTFDSQSRIEPLSFGAARNAHPMTATMDMVTNNRVKTSPPKPALLDLLLADPAPAVASVLKTQIFPNLSEKNSTARDPLPHPAFQVTPDQVSRPDVFTLWGSDLSSTSQPTHLPQNPLPSLYSISNANNVRRPSKSMTWPSDVSQFRNARVPSPPELPSNLPQGEDTDHFEFLSPIGRWHIQPAVGSETRASIDIHVKIAPSNVVQSQSGLPSPASSLAEPQATVLPTAPIARLPEIVLPNPAPSTFDFSSPHQSNSEKSDSPSPSSATLEIHGIHLQVTDSTDTTDALNGNSLLSPLDPRGSTPGQSDDTISECAVEQNFTVDVTGTFDGRVKSIPELGLSPTVAGTTSTANTGVSSALDNPIPQIPAPELEDLRSHPEAPSLGTSIIQGHGHVPATSPRAIIGSTNRPANAPASTHNTLVEFILRQTIDTSVRHDDVDRVISPLGSDLFTGAKSLLQDPVPSIEEVSPTSCHASPHISVASEAESASMVSHGFLLFHLTLMAGITLWNLGSDT